MPQVGPRSLYFDVTGDARAEKVKLPSCIRSSKPGALPNTQVWTIPRPPSPTPQHPCATSFPGPPFPAPPPNPGKGLGTRLLKGLLQLRWSDLHFIWFCSVSSFNCNVYFSSMKLKIPCGGVYTQCRWREEINNRWRAFEALSCSPRRCHLVSWRKAVPTFTACSLKMSVLIAVGTKWNNHRHQQDCVFFINLAL